MTKLVHPRKDEVGAIRVAILGADSSIAEGIKWNAPSYRTTDYFATTNLREKAGIGVILHLGTKVRETPQQALPIADPEGLLKWLAKDRAMVVFNDMQDLAAKKIAFVDLIRQWIAHV